MKPKSKEHIEFCNLVSKGTTYKDAYYLQVGCKNNTSDATCEQQGSRLAKKYAEYIQELKERISTAIDKAHENSAVNEALKEILTVAQVDGYLCDAVKKGDTRAMDIYYKRFGSYSPIQTEIKGSIKTTKELTPEQAKEYLKEIENAV